MEYLDGLRNDLKPNELPGLDCSVVRTKIPGYYTVSTTDFFNPSVDDPYIQGRIAGCNVLSDMYAMGVTDIDTLLMILGVSVDMETSCSDYVTKAMIKGFCEVASEAGTNVTGGQTVRNPWPMIGGVATSICKEGEDFVWPNRAVDGDLVVLTKPLGTQVAVNMFEWLRTDVKYAKIKDHLSLDDIVFCYKQAMESMSFLNKEAALLMKKYHAHACTDVTGFGILGHCSNLAKEQLNAVDFIIDTLPVIKNMGKIDSILGNNWKLNQGRSAETSGGLLVAMNASDVKPYIEEYHERTGHEAWVVGKVVAGSNKGIVSENATIIDVQKW